MNARQKLTGEFVVGFDFSRVVIGEGGGRVSMRKVCRLALCPRKSRPFVSLSLDMTEVLSTTIPSPALLLTSARSYPYRWPERILLLTFVYLFSSLPA